MEELFVKESPETIRVLVNHHRQFLAFLERRIGNRSVAEDILQEAFARGMARVNSLREGESAVAWFYRTLRNAVTDYYRRNGTANRALESFANELEAHIEPESDVRAQVCQCVMLLAATLKPEYASALKRIEVDGLALSEYANEIGITTGNAATRIFRAREALRRQVATSCGTCAEHGCLNCTCGTKSACSEKN